MEKQIINVELDSYCDWSYLTSLEEVEKDIIKMKEAGVTHIEVYYDDGVICKCFNRRLETDEEFNTRINKISDYEKKVKESELKELERLKAKYENGK